MGGSRLPPRLRGPSREVARSRERRIRVRSVMLYDGEGASARVRARISERRPDVRERQRASAQSRRRPTNADGCHRVRAPRGTIDRMRRSRCRTTYARQRAVAGAWFLRVWKDKLPASTQVVAVNNLTVGPGIFSFGASGDFAGNYPVLDPALGDRSTLDFRLAGDSWLRSVGGAAPSVRANRSRLPRNSACRSGRRRSRRRSNGRRARSSRPMRGAERVASRSGRAQLLEQRGFEAQHRLLVDAGARRRSGTRLRRARPVY